MDHCRCIWRDCAHLCSAVFYDQRLFTTPAFGKPTCFLHNTNSEDPDPARGLVTILFGLVLWRTREHLHLWFCVELTTLPGHVLSFMVLIYPARYLYQPAHLAPAGQ